jgi:hypothetical protein
MSDKASLKGIILNRSWTQLNQLLDEGRVSRDELEVRLEQRELEILDCKIEPDRWYSVEVAASFGEVVGDLSGHEGPSDWIAHGVSLTRMILDEANTGAGFEEGSFGNELAGRRLVSLVSSLLNFGRLRFEGGVGEFRLFFTGVSALPEVVRYTLHGMIQSIAEHLAARSVRLESRRNSDGDLGFSGFEG